MGGWEDGRMREWEDGKKKILNSTKKKNPMIRIGVSIVVSDIFLNYWESNSEMLREEQALSSVYCILSTVYHARYIKGYISKVCTK